MTYSGLRPSKGIAFVLLVALSGCFTNGPDGQGELPKMSPEKFRGLLVGQGEMGIADENNIELKSGTWELRDVRAELNGGIWFRSANLSIIGSHLRLWDIRNIKWGDDPAPSLTIIDSTIQTDSVGFGTVGKLTVKGSTLTGFPEISFDDWSPSFGDFPGPPYLESHTATISDSIIGPLDDGTIAVAEAPPRTTFFGRELTLATPSRMLDFSATRLDLDRLTIEAGAGHPLPVGPAPPLTTIRGLHGRIDELSMARTVDMEVHPTYRLELGSWNLSASQGPPHIFSGGWTEMIGATPIVVEPCPLSARQAHRECRPSDSSVLMGDIPASQCKEPLIGELAPNIALPYAGASLMGRGHWLNVTEVTAGRTPAAQIIMAVHVQGKTLPYLHGHAFYSDRMVVRVPLLEEICMEDGKPPVAVDGYDLYLKDYNVWWGCAHVEPEATSLDLVMLPTHRREEEPACAALQQALAQLPDQ